MSDGVMFSIPIKSRFEASLGLCSEAQVFPNPRLDGAKPDPSKKREKELRYLRLTL